VARILNRGTIERCLIQRSPLPPKVILGVKFADGIEVVRREAQAAAA